MKPKSLPKLAALTFAILALTPVIGANADRLGGFDFSYQASGDAWVRPVQVFDDGHSTYFQFRAGEPVPAIFAEAANGPLLLIPQNEGPYVKVTSLSGGYALRLGYGVGRVSYQGEGRFSPPAPEIAPTAKKLSSTLGRLNTAAQMVTASYRAPAVQVAATEISAQTNSYATPLKGDRVEWKEPEQQSKDYFIVFTKGQAKMLPASVKALVSMLPSDKNTSAYEIVGRDDDTYKEGLPEARAAAIVDFLVARGVPSEKIRTKSGVPLQSESNSKTVTGVTIRWYTEASVRVAQDPAQAVLARLIAKKISPQEAISELSYLQRATADVPSRSPELAPVSATWQILKSDANLRGTLARWEAGSGWRVQWADAPEVRINSDIKINVTDFISAADYAITQAKKVGYRIKATAYSNKVLIISEDKST